MNSYYNWDNEFESSNYMFLLNRQTTSTDALSKTPVLNRPTLRSGNKGEYVDLLQAQLKQLMFYNGDINGNFDSNTLSSVKAFQTNNKLAVDGVVGKDTWSALIYLYSPLAICGGNFHVVKAGDTLWSISRKYNTTVEELKRLNNLTSDVLSIGQKLILPGSEEVIPPIENDTTLYIVQKGDTLWGIAKKFNTTVAGIKSYNNLTSDTLSIGQQLLIPKVESTFNYTVQKGDTLWAIANRFNTTVDSIKALNNLTSNLLSIGQVLKIQSN